MSPIAHANGVDITFIDSHLAILDDLLKGKHNPETAFLPDNDTFHPGEGTGPDANLLARRQQGMVLDPPLFLPHTQRVNGIIGQRSRLVAGTANYGQRTWHIQHSHPFQLLDVNKDVTGKRKVECNL